MDSLRIETGVKRVMINDDPTRVIKFNPNDVTWAEKFYKLIGEFQAKEAEFKQRAQDLDERSAEIDENGFPVNMGDGLAFLREVCEYLRSEIDKLFGPGASQAAFEDAMTFEMFDQFFTGISPFIQAARQERLTRYLNEKNAGRVMK